MDGSGFRRRLAWLIGLRAVVGTILLGSATVAQLRAPGSLPIDPFFFLIALVYALTIVYALLLRMTDRHPWLIDVQLAGDALIVSAFISLTGGVTSQFASLYALPIIAGSMLRFRRGGLLVATLNAVLFVGVVLQQYLGAQGDSMAPWFASGPPLPPAALARLTVAWNVFGFFAVAFLSGSLAESLRSTGQRLERASTAIADLQALNEYVINSLQSGLVITDPQRCVLGFNRGAETITGLSLAEVAGRAVGEVLQLPAPMLDALDEELEASGVRRIDYWFKTPVGREVEIGLSAAHLMAPGGRAGYLFTFQDVTKVKKLERDALIQQRLAAVGEMAAGIAHEIRNPLASMSGSIQVLRQDLPLNEEQEQLMDIVLRESDRLNRTIRSFLAYARPQRFEVSRFDVRRTLTDSALLLRNSNEVLPTHGIDTALPGEPVWCEADEGQIKQIVWNLATNGLRAMPQGGHLHLSARTRETGDAVVLEVGDEGIGIDADEIDGIFQPFNGRFDRGSGLGLAIVHRIVADYEGQIHVQSQPGRGTTVTITLPVRVQTNP